MDFRDFEYITKEEKIDSEQTRKSLTYWQDVWRRLKKNKLSMAGLAGVITIMLFGVFGPILSPYKYSDQELDFKNITPKFDIYEVADEEYILVTQDYRVIITSEDGDLLYKLDDIYKDVMNRIYYFAYEQNIELADNYFGHYLLSVEEEASILASGAIYSQRWGIALLDADNEAGENEIQIFFIHEDSPFSRLSFEGVEFDFNLEEQTISSIRFLHDETTIPMEFIRINSDDGAQEFIDQLEIESVIAQFVVHGEVLTMDYSYGLMEEAAKPAGYEGVDIEFMYRGEPITTTYDSVFNQTFIFGSDALGRDLLTRVMYGARISLLVAFIATIVNFVIGITYGSLSGYSGGTVDNIMMRIVDIINSIPLTLYVILLMVVLREKVIDIDLFGKNYTIFDGSDGLVTIIIALGSIYWVGMARLVRGQILGLKEQEYVLAARTIGVSKAKIIIRHLVPNAMGPIIVSMTMMIPSAVFTEAFLSFIGLGVSAPQASWGTLANEALSAFQYYPYQLFFPSAAIALTMLAFNFLGDGLRDALDPRLRKG
ncbi:MAG: ABC transporter permease [Candidatus Izemoplasma sp.]